VLDESGNFLLVPSLLGIKVINIATNSVSRIIGQPENTERFLAIALWQGLPKKVGPGLKEGGGGRGGEGVVVMRVV
jgi:peptidylprolyl isomerase domain and WD repeat-containing protein 1